MALNGSDGSPLCLACLAGLCRFLVGQTRIKITTSTLAETLKQGNSHAARMTESALEEVYD